MSSVASASPSLPRVEVTPGVLFRVSARRRRGRGRPRRRQRRPRARDDALGDRPRRAAPARRECRARATRVPGAAARRELPPSSRSSSRSRSAAWSPGAGTRPGPSRCTWAVAAVALGLALVVVASLAARRSGAARLAARLPHADEAADHDAPPPHRRRRHVRRRAGSAAARALRGHDGRPRARLRRSVRAQPRARPRHRRPHGQPHEGAPGRLRPRVAGAGARVRDPALGRLVRAPRLRASTC